MKSLETIPTPAYIADIAAIERNMEVVRGIKGATGCAIVLALKAFAMPAVFDVMREVLDGTTASGLYEARLGAEEFGKDVHTYSPAYGPNEWRDCLKYSNHIYFNSVGQLQKFGPLIRAEKPSAKIGLRVNPGLSLVKNSSLYDPSAPNCRFGVHKDELSDAVLKSIDILHFHNLCENRAEDSARLIDHVMNDFGFALKYVDHVNLGGGHYITHPDYKIDLLIDAINRIQSDCAVHVTLEPGGALVYNAGYLITKVEDIIPHDPQIAILDTSASTHMPDVLEVPYRPDLIGAGEPDEKPHTYILGGKTCMAGDVIGEYSFDEPLEIGKTLIFTDMLQYSFVKNTTFNGVPLPDLGLLDKDGSYRIVKKFGYEDFKNRLG